MDMLLILSLVEKHTDKRFMHFDGSIVTKLSNGDVIPLSHIYMGKYPAMPGFYLLSPRTCGHKHSCVVGKPNKNCGTYQDPIRCGVYNYEEATFGYISIDKLFKIIEDLA